MPRKRLWQAGIVLVVALTLLLPGPRPHAPLYAMSSQQQLLPGDILLMSGPTLQGAVVRRIDAGPYSHVAIVALDEGGRTWIVDTAASDGAARPAGIAVRRDIGQFLRETRAQRLDVFRVDTAPHNRLAAARQAWAYAQARPAFDDEFQLRPDKLYCTELVWYSYCIAGIDLVGDRARDLSCGFLRFRNLITPGTLLGSPLLVHVERVR